MKPDNPHVGFYLFSVILCIRIKSEQKIRVTKEFSFDMAHALFGHDGPCANIHGHTYHLSVTVIGKITEKTSNPKNGMVIDFTDFKSIVKRHIVDMYDHSLVLNEVSPHREIKSLQSGEQKIILTAYQPTCENLLLDFVEVLKRNLPSFVSLASVKLRETPSSYAEWHQCDNN